LWHRPTLEPAPVDHPLAEDWHGRFAIVEAGAQVSPEAQIQDSVVLAGAKVPSGAVVVRSVVCPGAVLSEGASPVDALVYGTESNF
jgi:NDP-sugar pyrophosphorylase family protein